MKSPYDVTRPQFDQYHLITSFDTFCLRFKAIAELGHVVG